jgi:type II secretory pathway pseudopilin PulG
MALSTNRQIDKSTNRQIDKSTNRQKVKSKSKSFTLVEIVFTISIIGILLAILLPAMSAIKLSAQKVKDVSNLKKIAEAWYEYTINRGNAMNLMTGEGWSWTDYGNWFALTLAGCTQDPSRFYPSKCILNDPHVYVSPGDKYAKVIEESIVARAGNTEGCDLQSAVICWKRIDNTDFNLPNGFGFSSYCTIANLDGSVPLTTTPIAFTRGLKSDGTWDEKYGLYGTKGGYVVFCDGHTTWFDGSKPAKFLHWNQKEYTTDIHEAVPNKAKIGNGGISAPSGNYNNLVIWGSGNGGS